MLCLSYAYVMLMLCLRYAFGSVIGFLLANEESKNNNSDTHPLPERQLFAKETKHQKCRKNWTYIVEDIGFGHSHVTDTITEKHKRRHRT